MSRQLFCFSVLSLALSACSGVDSKRAEGDFEYANKVDAKGFVIPQSLDTPPTHDDFLITNEISHAGPVGELMDIRAPSLVLPVAASSRAVVESDKAIIWFDKVLEHKDLLDFIEKSISDNLGADSIELALVEEQPASGEKLGKSKRLNSGWFTSEVESGWIFTEIESTTALRFNFTLQEKSHGRSVSLLIDLADYKKTDVEGESNSIDPIDEHRAEMAMLNAIVAQVDYNYRLEQRELRLERARQKLVSLGESTKAEPAYVVEMSLDNLWENMPVFFEKYGFTISDLNETNKVYYVDFIKPDNSMWSSLWGDDVPVIDLANDKYQFKLAPLDDKDQKTSVTLRDNAGEPLNRETLERIFAEMEAGLSFRNFY